jgi:hypothetical protein
MHNKPSGVVILDLTPEGCKLLKILDKDELDAVLILYPDTGWELTYDWLKHVLRDGFIEHVRLPGVGEMWIDNELATTLFHICDGPYDGIVGTAIVMLDPDFVPPEEVSNWVVEHTHPTDH